MIAGAASRRYAKSLFQLAESSGVLEPVHTDLHDFGVLLQEHRLLRAVFYSPEVSQSLLEEILDDLLTGKTPQLLLQFLKLLAQKNRQSLFEGVVHEFDRLYRQSKGQVVAVVKTAAALDEQMSERLAESLQKTFHAEILLNHQVDPKLLGGMVVEVEGKLIDLSLKRKLEELKKHLDPSLLSASIGAAEIIE